MLGACEDLRVKSDMRRMKMITGVKALVRLSVGHDGRCVGELALERRGAIMHTSCTRRINCTQRALDSGSFICEPTQDMDFIGRGVQTSRLAGVFA